MHLILLLTLTFTRISAFLEAGGHTCAQVLADDELKCFGRNDYGQLGYGDTNNRGDEANQMGDTLLEIDLGSDFTVISTGIPTSSPINVPTSVPTVHPTSSPTNVTSVTTLHPSDVLTPFPSASSTTAPTVNPSISTPIPTFIATVDVSPTISTDRGDEGTIKATYSNYT
eukprot:934922_1